MFDTINGLPIHPLVVHGVVVLLPLAAIGTVAIVLKRSWRRTYGWLVVVAAAAGTLMLPVATQSGEALEDRVGDPGEHADLGESLIWFALPLLVLLVVLVMLERRSSDDSADSGASTPLRVVSVMALVAAVAVGVQTYRVGDSGAEAVWADIITATND